MEKVKIKGTELLVQDGKEPLAMFGLETSLGWHPIIKKVLGKKRNSNGKIFLITDKETKEL